MKTTSTPPTMPTASISIVCIATTSLFLKPLKKKKKRHGNKDILCITNDADNHSRYVLAAVPHLARIYDGRLCISAYRLDSRRTYPVQTIQTNIQLV